MNQKYLNNIKNYPSTLQENESIKQNSLHISIRKGRYEHNCQIETLKETEY